MPPPSSPSASPAAASTISRATIPPSSPSSLKSFPPLLSLPILFSARASNPPCQYSPNPKFTSALRYLNRRSVSHANARSAYRETIMHALVTCGFAHTRRRTDCIVAVGCRRRRARRRRTAAASVVGRGGEEEDDVLPPPPPMAAVGASRTPDSSGAAGGGGGEVLRGENENDDGDLRTGSECPLNGDGRGTWTWTSSGRRRRRR